MNKRIDLTGYNRETSTRLGTVPRYSPEPASRNLMVIPHASCFMKGEGVTFIGGNDLPFSVTDIAVVPEPSTWALLLGGLTLVLASRRRRVS